MSADREAWRLALERGRDSPGAHCAVGRPGALSAPTHQAITGELIPRAERSAAGMSGRPPSGGRCLERNEAHRGAWWRTKSGIERTAKRNVVEDMAWSGVEGSPVARASAQCGGACPGGGHLY
ncbi:MAG TPA: hypothetical protein VN426_17720 [Syntrophomonadaceae bacterium]|nr:hypothetical protein [Syntrophomonadaceae bacterium]